MNAAAALLLLATADTFDNVLAGLFTHNNY
jgi:hypothetical protein